MIEYRSAADTCAAEPAGKALLFHPWNKERIKIISAMTVQKKSCTL
jgi:hypothetical protein